MKSCSRTGLTTAKLGLYSQFAWSIKKRTSRLPLPNRIVLMSVPYRNLFVRYLPIIVEGRLKDMFQTAFLYQTGYPWEFPVYLLIALKASARVAMTSSIKPYSLAASEDMKLSRSVSRSTFSKGWPVCLANNSFSFCLSLISSRA